MPLGKGATKIYIGQEYLTLKSLTESNDEQLTSDVLEHILCSSTGNKVDYIVLPIDLVDNYCYESVNTIQNVIHRQHKMHEWGIDLMKKSSHEYTLSPVTGSDLQITSDTLNWSIVYSMSSWIMLDSLDPNHLDFIQYSQNVFTQQLSWASHCGVYAIILPTPSVNIQNNTLHWSCARYGALLAKFVSIYLQTRLWVRIPLAAEIETHNTDTSTNFKQTTSLDGWYIWNELKHLVSSPTLGVVLELTATIPENEEVFNRWLAEPIQAIIIPFFIFRFNSAGIPVLPKIHKQFVSRLLRHKIQIIIQHAGHNEIYNFNDFKHTTIDHPLQTQPCTELLPLCRFVECIEKIHLSLPPLTYAEQFELPCLDQLQTPLQPLRDNLESQTYETFEKDPVKYSKYEAAIVSCLKDRIQLNKQRHVLIIVGAGRGPLVACALRALQSAHLSNAQYRVIAIEKNDNAVITLKYRVLHDPNIAWRHVEIVSSDMREYICSEKADILISELLGSFGDNELSPECLDGAQQLLNPHDGICIPESYFSSLEPISCPKLWNESKNQLSEGISSVDKNLETSHVVKFHSVYYLSNEGPTSCFSFTHPSPTLIKKDNTHNHRYKQFIFTAKIDSMCHGFACYFHSVLYKDVTISIHPPTFSEGMISWFPLYLSLRQPFFIKQGEKLNFHIWRLSNTYQVWYEWCVTEPIISDIHNINGRSHAIMK